MQLLLAESVAGFAESYPDVEVHLEPARGLVDQALADAALTDGSASSSGRRHQTPSPGSSTRRWPPPCSSGPPGPSPWSRRAASEPARPESSPRRSVEKNSLPFARHDRAEPELRLEPTGQRRAGRGARRAPRRRCGAASRPRRPRRPARRRRRGPRSPAPGHDLRPHGHVVAVHLQVPLPLEELAPAGALGLVPREHHAVAGVGHLVGQVVHDAATCGHARKPTR